MSATKGYDLLNLLTNIVSTADRGNLVTTTANTNTAGPSQTWGLDLSGMRQGAGGIGGLLARTDANGSTFYQHDAGGNITAMTDGNGNILARYLYDPFGNLLAKSGIMAEANRYRFSSKEMHANSGLYYYGYRYYEPNLQRWLNQDPMGEYGGLNLYQFLYNKPVNFVDPDGLWGVKVGGINFGWGDPTYDFDGVDWDGYWGDVGDTALGELKGAGSELSFGLYKPCYTSDLQRQGGYVGVGLAMAGETLAGYGAAGKATKWSGKEFSHAIPARSLPGGRGGALDKFLTKTKLNGNHVPIREHALSDPIRHRTMPEAWRKANPLRNPFERTLDRVPRFPLGMGAAAAGGYAASQNDGGCR